METPIRLLIVDDHTIARKGIVALLEEEPQIIVVEQAHNGQDALEKLCLANPDVVLMDIGMPVMDGLQATQQIKQTEPSVRILALTMHDEHEYVLKIMQAGASGYVLKDVSAEELVRAILTVYQGGSYLCAGASRHLFQTEISNPPETENKLTARESEVLKLIAKGFCNKEIAKALNISLRTAQTNRQNIRRKLGIYTTAGLTLYAVEHGLVHISQVPPNISE